MCDKMAGLSDADIAEINGLFETEGEESLPTRKLWDPLTEEELEVLAQSIVLGDIANERLVSYVPLVDDTEA